MTEVDEVVVAVAALDPILLALLVPLAAISVTDLGLWVVLKVTTNGGGNRG